MKKAFLKWHLLNALFFIALPWLTITFVKGANGMAVCMLLFYLFDPLWAIFAGVWAGRQIRLRWQMPLLVSVFFLLGTWLCFDMGETDFLLYAAAYLLIGCTTMLISHLFKQIRQKPFK